ncbi:MAG: delta-60 repeat domain-containing protein [Planctomycetaceae bacterium]
MILVNGQYYQDAGKDVLVQSDGKIVIVGEAKTSSTTTKMFMTRLDASGDVLFAPTTFATGTTESARTFDAALQTDGKVLVTGYTYGTAFEAWLFA